jgi:hypothetical protein
MLIPPASDVLRIESQHRAKVIDRIFGAAASYPDWEILNNDQLAFISVQRFRSDLAQHNIRSRSQGGMPSSRLNTSPNNTIADGFSTKHCSRRVTRASLRSCRLQGIARTLKKALIICAVTTSFQFGGRTASSDTSSAVSHIPPSAMVSRTRCHWGLRASRCDAHIRAAFSRSWATRCAHSATSVRAVARASATESGPSVIVRFVGQERDARLGDPAVEAHSGCAVSTSC